MTSKYRFQVTRAARPRWSVFPASGEGAAKTGGRFNAIGVPALYTSLKFETCALEVRFALNTDPFVFYQLDVESNSIADLTSPLERQKYEVDWADIECPNWESEMNKGLVPASQRIANRLIQEGVHGILVPSFASRAGREDINLVLWKWATATDHDGNLDMAARVTVLSPNELPQNQSSWP